MYAAKFTDNSTSILLGHCSETPQSPMNGPSDWRSQDKQGTGGEGEESAPDIVAFPSAVIVPAAVLAAEARGEGGFTGGDHQEQGVRVEGQPLLVQQTGHDSKQLGVAEPGSLSPYKPPVSSPPSIPLTAEMETSVRSTSELSHAVL